MTRSFGDALRKAREEKGLSLDQVSKAIFIRPNYLEALENGDRAGLPSNVQGRGFLRLYATFLELPIDPLIAAWDGKPSLEDTPPINGDVPQENFPTEAGPEENSPEIERVPPYSEGESGGEHQDSSAIFLEIGDLLRTQRTALGLSLAEVERYTRLRQHYLQSLEAGILENMPSPVQARGMLINYAGFLNLDEEKILLRFAEGLQARRVEKNIATSNTAPPVRKKKSARPAPFWKRYITPDLIFGIGLAAVILFSILWTAARINALSKRTDEPTTPPITDILLTPYLEETLNANSTTQTPFSTSQVATLSDTLLGQDTMVTQADNNLSIINQDESSSIIPTLTIAPINNDPFQIYIVARDRAWLQVIADDKVRFQGRVVPGNAYAFSGSKRVELVTGNASALQVFYNQMDLGILGSTGQVVSLIFAPEGIITPTPMFTPSALATRTATITPLPSKTPLASPTITPFVP